MGKRGIIRKDVNLSAGVSYEFESLLLVDKANLKVLVHHVSVAYPAGNMGLMVSMLRQPRSHMAQDSVVAQEYGFDESCTIDEAILFDFDYPYLQVGLGVVAVSGAFNLNVEYEEVS